MDIKPKKPTEKILNALAKLSQLPKAAEKEALDLKVAQTEITWLKAELSKGGKAVNPGPLPNNDKAMAAAREEMRKHYAGVIKERDAMVVAAQGQVRKLQGTLVKICQLAGGTPMDIPAIPIAPSPRAIPIAVPARAPQATKAATSTAGKLPAGECRVLTACAQFPNGLRRDQFTVLLGYKRSSRDAFIQRLREKGLVEQRDSKIFPTTSGLETLGPDFEPLPTGSALQEYWLENLPAGEKNILQILIDAYPEAVSRDVVSEKTGYMRSSRDAFIQRMGAKEIILIESRGFVKASENLFDL